MPCWDAIRWPLRATSLSANDRAALEENVEQDARALGLDAASYRAWITAALQDDADAGPARARLANTALGIHPLSEHVDALVALSTTRPAGLQAWTLAELRITTNVAQLRFDDPSSTRNRLATLGKAAGTLGHELRNPLGVIESSAYLLQRNPSLDEKALRHVEKVRRHAGACHRIIEDLMHLARNAPPRLESIDVSEAFALAVEEAALPPVVMCRIEAPPGLRVHADPGLLQRALVNLLRNANTAMQGEGAVRLGVLEHPSTLSLWIRDHGPGFEPDLLRVAFDPLATTSGIGLGLALVDSVMRRHGGEAEAHNEPDGGARVVLHFPRPAQ
jgi:signal transduction histidine kinase